MARYLWCPATPGLIGHGPGRRLVGRKGDVVELDDEAFVAYQLAHVPGEGGRPCLIRLDEQVVTAAPDLAGLAEREAVPAKAEPKPKAKKPKAAPEATQPVTSAPSVTPLITPEG